MVSTCDLDGLTRYECLLRLSSEGRALLGRHARPVRALPSLFRQEGETCDAVTLLAVGQVSVGKRRASGREILLYRFGAGEVCVLEALAVLAGTAYRAEAVIEQAIVGVAIPADVFRRLTDSEPELRSFLFRSFEARLAMALELVSDVALGTLETRLAALLLRHVAATGEVRATHERLAQELACGREAVSRTLGAWERAGIVQLGRAHLQVIDATKLGALAEKAHEVPHAP